LTGRSNVPLLPFVGSFPARSRADIITSSGIDDLAKLGRKLGVLNAFEKVEE
jgi:hypothetical protein